MDALRLLCLVVAAATAVIWAIYMAVFLRRARREKSSLPLDSALAGADKPSASGMLETAGKGREEGESQDLNWKEVDEVESDQVPSHLSGVSALLGVVADLLMAVCVFSRVESGRGDIVLPSGDVLHVDPRAHVEYALDLGNMSTAMFLAVLLGVAAIVIGVIGARREARTGAAILGILTGVFVLAIPFLVAAFYL